MYRCFKDRNKVQYFCCVFLYNVISSDLIVLDIVLQNKLPIYMHFFKNALGTIAVWLVAMEGRQSVVGVGKICYFANNFA